ncbi:MAG: hypothetical protein DRO06_04005 [Thermoproteota archaeon]|nr:MAG: hypothetical protein DRO06_04005 [Candidatus Korarchaeota archaeon]
MSEEHPYEKLISLWLKELCSPELEVSDEEVEEIRSWVAELREAASRSDSPEYIKAAFSFVGEVLSHLLEVRALKSRETVHLETLPSPPEIPAPPAGEGTGLSLVIFKTALPRFVGSDLEVYGPFRGGDLAILPREDAEVLEARGAVEVLEDEGSE